jgi:hypothetical protein
MDQATVIARDDFSAALPADLLALFLGESATLKAKSPKKPARSQRRKISSRKSR